MDAQGLQVGIAGRGARDGYGFWLGDLAVLIEGVEIIAGMFAQVEAGLSFSPREKAACRCLRFGELRTVADVGCIVADVSLTIPDVRFGVKCCVIPILL